MGFGGSGGGNSRIATSLDVALNNPINTEVLTYDQAASKWKNAVISGIQGPPGAGKQPLTSDDFSGADIPSINGRVSDSRGGGTPTTWEGASSWGIANNRLVSQSQNIGFIGLAQSTSDYELTAKLVNLTDSGNGTRTLSLRRQSLANTGISEYRVEIKSNGQCILSKLTNSSPTIFSTSETGAVQSGDTLSFKIVGKILSFSVNDIPLLSAVDQWITGPGYAGFGKSNAVVDFSLSSVKVWPYTLPNTNEFIAADYGIVANGINDDTDILEELAVIASSKASASTMSIIKLPPGKVMRIAAFATFDQTASNIIFEGQGVTMLKDNPTNEDLLSFNGTTNFRLKNIYFNFGVRNVGASASIVLENTQKVVIDGCSFANGRRSIRIKTSGTNGSMTNGSTKDITISNNYFGTSADYALCAIPNENYNIPVNVQFLSNRITNIERGDVPSGVTYTLSPSAIYGHFQESLFANNRVENSYDTSIMLTGGTDNRIIGNYLFSDMVGIYLGGGSFDMNGTTIVRPLRRTTITGNNISSVTDYGVHQLCRPDENWNSSTVADLIVSGNNIFNCGKAGLATQGASYVSFTSNIISNCGLRTPDAGNEFESSGIVVTGYGAQNQTDVPRYSQHIMIADNIVRKASNNQINYGIRVFGSADTSNAESLIVSNNDVAGSYTISAYGISTNLGAGSYIQADNFTRDMRAYGSTRTAASVAGRGAEFFDISINKKIWSDGTNWRDASGSIV